MHNPCAREHSRVLEREARSKVVLVAPRCWYVLELVADSLQFLDHEAATASAAKCLIDFHVDIAVSRIIMEEESASRDDSMVRFQTPIAYWFESVMEDIGTFGVCQRTELKPGMDESCRQSLRKKDRVTAHVDRIINEHEQKQAIVRLSFNGYRRARRKKFLEEV